MKIQENLKSKIPKFLAGCIPSVMIMLGGSLWKWLTFPGLVLYHLCQLIICKRFPDDGIECYLSSLGMNAAVRAIVRMGIYVGCNVYLIKEVSTSQNHRLLV